MPHVIEPALSGRAKCRGCDRPIPKGELRLGEREANPFGEGEMTIWFHLLCGAFKRPEVLLEVLKTADTELANTDSLRNIAEHGIAHRRLPRVDGAQRAPSGRATCRSCRELIRKDTWRIPLVYFDMGRFQGSGNIHAGCALEYLGTRDVMDRIRHFSPDLDGNELEEIRGEMEAGGN